MMRCRLCRFTMHYVRLMVVDIFPSLVTKPVDRCQRGGNLWQCNTKVSFWNHIHSPFFYPPTPRTACIRLATKLFPSGLLLAKAPSALANIKAGTFPVRRMSVAADGACTVGSPLLMEMERGAEGFGDVVSADDGGGAIAIG